MSRRFSIPVVIPTVGDVRAAIATAKAANELRTAKRAVRKAQKAQLHELAEQLVREQRGGK